MADQSPKKRVFSGNLPENTAGWTRWRTLEPSTAFSEKSLAETLGGGQAFRWKQIGSGTWEGIWGQSVARVRLGPNGSLQWKCPVALNKRTTEDIHYYFTTGRDYENLIDLLPWRSDEVIHTAIKEWRGLRILRQPIGETLFCFLCSSNKQIVQIKQICEATARRVGSKITAGYYSLPDWNTLQEIPEKELRLCKTGYRARYIKQTAEILADDPNFLGNLHTLPYPRASEKLRRLPGVGEKIAHCVLLFGAGRMEAFPVDVWIQKTMERQYGLEGWRREQIAHFGQTHFGSLAGLAQQFLFAAERGKS